MTLLLTLVPVFDITFVDKYLKEKVLFVLVCYLKVLTNPFIIYHFVKQKTHGIVINVTGHFFILKRSLSILFRDESDFSNSKYV